MRGNNAETGLRDDALIRLIRQSSEQLHEISVLLHRHWDGEAYEAHLREAGDLHKQVEDLCLRAATLCLEADGRSAKEESGSVGGGSEALPTDFLN